MKLSAPVHLLKHKAKELKRSRQITYMEALDQIARTEGYASWSLLQSRINAFIPGSTDEILNGLFPGDLMLIGARPGLGKTMLTLKLLLQAIRQGRTCFFFSLEFTRADVMLKLSQLDGTYAQDTSLLKLDCSDEIASTYIISKTRDTIQQGSLIGIDYLQLLDQQRDKPPLQEQIEELKIYARETRCALIFISQIDRAFDQNGRDRPDLEDIRLPNPLDTGLFNKSVFVNDDQMYLR